MQKPDVNERSTAKERSLAVPMVVVAAVQERMLLVYTYNCTIVHIIDKIKLIHVALGADTEDVNYAIILSIVIYIRIGCCNIRAII